MNLVKTKRHKAWHVIYTSVIANLIFLAYSNSRSHYTSPRVNVTTSCLHCWSTDLTKRKLAVQCTISMELDADKVQNINSAYRWTYKWINDVNVFTLGEPNLCFVWYVNAALLLLITNINIKQFSVIKKQCTVFKCTERKQNISNMN